MRRRVVGAVFVAVLVVVAAVVVVAVVVAAEVLCRCSFGCGILVSFGALDQHGAARSSCETSKRLGRGLRCMRRRFWALLSLRCLLVARATAGVRRICFGLLACGALTPLTLQLFFKKHQTCKVR